jgi:recombinational DNA repair ATPase RecF
MHADAIGYLNDLAKEVNEQWFTMVCDLVSVSGLSVLDDQATRELFALYARRASYIGIKSAAVAAMASPPSPADFLEQLSRFSNFKRLGDDLEITFKKRITVVFGANGSGKSSLCESLKVLATPEAPIRPLQNVRATGAVVSEFHYKFTSDAVHRTWTQALGYGPRRATVKYFDTAIAIRNVRSAFEPGRVIVLSPFKLHVFEWAKTLTTKFRESVQQAQVANSTALNLAFETIRKDFGKFKDCSLSTIEEKSSVQLLAQIKLGEAFAEQKVLAEKLAAAAELEKAASEEGLKLLRAEHRELDNFLTSLNTLLDAAAGFWRLDSVNKAMLLVEKQVAQGVLAEALIQKDGTLDGLLALLRAASPLCTLQEAAGHACPLCKRELGAPEVELFKLYNSVLVGELEKDISALKVDIAKAVELATAAVNVNRNAWDQCITIRAEVLTAAKTGADLVVANCIVAKEPSIEARAAFDVLKSSTVQWADQLDVKKSAIETAGKGRDELIRELAKLRAEIAPLEYAQTIAEKLEDLKGVQRNVVKAAFWKKSLPAFTQVLKRITQKAKDAHEELVVIDFEARLNMEYIALAEKDMTAFGVTLARKGADAAVTLLPQIGGKEIEGVMSEGEQRIHALALFFAELETCPQSVLVFDDPISSFDYNYIANYCARLRDFTLKHPTRQIILLTHNWEFFVQIQTTLNQATLDSHLSVLVLENCAVVADYTEKIDDLKVDIASILAAVGEPSKAKKEEAAGKMRRLIESVVNAHVFNNQRHQYKQKSQAITAFQSFTKLVPLLPAEAITLRDLYGKLSITEHDDPRNAYVATDKAMFQARFSRILAIETAVAARKP